MLDIIFFILFKLSKSRKKRVNKKLDLVTKPNPVTKKRKWWLKGKRSSFFET